MLIKDGNYEKKFHSIQFFSTYKKKCFVHGSPSTFKEYICVYTDFIITSE